MNSLYTKLFKETMSIFTETLTNISSLSSDPLFSIIITSYTLVLLYFPRIFLSLIFSPILISTALLLSTLLRLGSTQTPPKEESLAATTTTATEQALQWVLPEPQTEHGYDSKHCFTESMIEWNRNIRAPLEVIHEEYEGEDENVSNQKDDNREIRGLGMDELVSLSLYYPESDSESSSDGDFAAIEGWDSPENMCFRWDEEDDDDKDGMYEIPLDGGSKRCSDFQVEEENLIEIDISCTGAPVSM